MSSLCLYLYGCCFQYVYYKARSDTTTASTTGICSVLGLGGVQIGIGEAVWGC